MVMNWLHSEAKPMNAALGGQIRQVQTFDDAHIGPAYYVVFLRPAGLVFVPADDFVEPIIGFVSDATSFDPSLSNPLGALVSQDIPGRVLKAREMESSARPERFFPRPAVHGTRPGINGTNSSQVIREVPTDLTKFPMYG